ncbi:MAG: hypothetical protein CR976_02255 [Thiotrichales bacterium]|nr:MAG: hypothetical protein CR976_02255 [Thiotrichales bacterium]
MQRTVFVSYARKDSDRIRRAVALLEAGGAQVFRDIDDIDFGDDWEQVITRQLQECERVMVFWSANAKESKWVNKEYTIALAQQKRMVPVLLDDTPLPPELSRYHALTDFMPEPPVWKKYAGWMVGGAAVTVLAGVFAWSSLQDVDSLSRTVPLAAESVDISPVDEAAGQQQRGSQTFGSATDTEVRSAPVPSVAARPSDPAAGGPVISQYRTDSVANASDITEGQKPEAPADPVSTRPVSEQQPLPPIFAWGAGLLFLLLLFLLWFRNRSDAALKKEQAGKAFVDMIFDEEQAE